MKERKIKISLFFSLGVKPPTGKTGQTGAADNLLGFCGSQGQTQTELNSVVWSFSRRLWQHCEVVLSRFDQSINFHWHQKRELETPTTDQKNPAV